MDEGKMIELSLDECRLVSGGSSGSSGSEYRTEETTDPSTGTTGTETGSPPTERGGFIGSGH